MCELQKKKKKYECTYRPQNIIGTYVLTILMINAMIPIEIGKRIQK